MSLWKDKKSSPPPQDSSKRVEVEGIVARCERCPAETINTWYLTEIGALSWKCEECGHLNILLEFNLP